MKITSQEIKQHVFEKSFRGYSIEEVDAFLDNLALEWEKNANESKMLKMQLEIAEKETSKLREVEMTLIKTLRTAEDTSSKITETANLAAGKKLQDAELQAHQIIADAENKAKMIVDEAEIKSQNINIAAKKEFEDLEARYNTLEAKRNNLLAQLKNIVNEGEVILDKNKIFTLEAPVRKEDVKPENKVLDDNDSNELVIAKAAAAPEEPVSVEIIDVSEETVEEPLIFSSAVNELKIDTPEPENLEVKTESDKTNLEIIEGIGPKIKQVLNNARIVTFRDLATTPVYRIKDILEAAGPHFAIHDPSTWVEQAMLADQENWEQLESLKNYLMAGRKPASGTFSGKNETDDASNEEMLEKVNKVKAAIRKSIIDTPDAASIAPETKTVNEYIAEKKQGGSFFDSLN